ncbi:MAG TPA: urea ABC transporter permease subunit UrtB [Steroidobacteraceae bacterium]|nr:urea ABC transporter permease subunit UrtB [Steroidobacteraceae bacterium]
MRLTFIVLLMLALAAGAMPRPASADEGSADAAFGAAAAQLANDDFASKEDAVRRILEQRHPGSKPLLAALLDGRVFMRSSDMHVFIVASADADPLELTEPVTLKSAGAGRADDFAKITTNNKLRKMLRGALARFDLGDADAGVRRAAVKEMLRSLDDDTIALLREQLRVEKDGKVRGEIESGLALADLTSSDKKVRLAAIAILRNSLHPDAYNALASIATPAADGSYTEPDLEVRNAAGAAMRKIERWRSFYSGLETLFFGLSLGSVLVLAAIGLAITFGVMGVINMAHGELMMLGAYCAYVMQLLMPNHIGASILVAIPVAFVVSGLVGIGIERGIVRWLYGRPLETLLATFGVSLILQQVVRDIFSANNRPVETPQWMSGSLEINEAFSITYNRLYVVIFALAVFILIQIVLKRTTLGLKVRAVSQNRPMARAMGVRAEWIDALTFGLGSGIAGVAGVALSQLTNVGPNLGQQYIVDSFMVVVFGGVGNLQGTLIGGMSLGVVNKLLEPYSGAVLAKILVLVALILFIQRRPRGLFPQKGRAAEN